MELVSPSFVIRAANTENLQMTNHERLSSSALSFGSMSLDPTFDLKNDFVERAKLRRDLGDAKAPALGAVGWARTCAGLVEPGRYQI
jgi:hypothetical protein